MELFDKWSGVRRAAWNEVKLELLNGSTKAQKAKSKPAAKENLRGLVRNPIRDCEELLEGAAAEETHEAKEKRPKETKTRKGTKGKRGEGKITLFSGRRLVGNAEGEEDGGDERRFC